MIDRLLKSISTKDKETAEIKELLENIKNTEKVFKENIEFIKKNNAEKDIIVPLHKLFEREEYNRDIIVAINKINGSIASFSYNVATLAIFQCKIIDYKNMLPKAVLICEDYFKYLADKFNLDKDIHNTFKMLLLNEVLMYSFTLFNEDVEKQKQDYINTKNQEEVSILFKLNNVKDILEKEQLLAKLNKIKEDVNNYYDNYYAQVIGLVDLKELLGIEGDFLTEIKLKEDFYFNFEEFNKYIKKLLKNGPYVDLKAKEKVFKNILTKNENDINFDRAEMMVLNKEIINHDYSTRQDLILEAMANYGDKKNPVVVTNNKGVVIKKYGLACDSKDKALFDFLLGQFVENNCNPTKVILRADMFEALHYNGKGSRFKTLKDSLNTIGTQMVCVDDSKAKDRATTQIAENISADGRKALKENWFNLFIVNHVEIDGQLAIAFNIPLMKYFSSHKQFARLVDNNVMEHWINNTRIYWISRELAALSRNKNNNVLKVSTLLKNIGEWDRYKNYKNKREYLKRFNDDFEKAKSYLKIDKKIVYNGCSPSTLLEARITCK